MKKLNLVLASVAALMGSAAFADTVTGTGGSFQTFALMGSNGIPYWNNTSSATINGSNAINIGNFLSDTGGYAQNSNVTPNCPTTDCGVNYESTPGNMFVGAGAASPTSFNFIKQGGALNISLLYANSAASSLVEFGIYDASSLANAQNNHTIPQSSGTNLANLDGHSYDPNSAAMRSSSTGPHAERHRVTLAAVLRIPTGAFMFACAPRPSSFQATTGCNGGANNVVTYFFNPSYDQNTRGRSGWS